GQDPPQEDPPPPARPQHLPAPAPAPEPPTPTPRTAALPPPAYTAVPVPTQPPAAPSVTSPAPASRITQLTESWLSEAIQSVPPDYGLTYLRFANYEAARIAAEAEDFEGMPTMLSEGFDTVPWTYTLLLGDSSVNSYRGEIYEATGLDFYVADTYIWTEPQAFSSPALRIITGVIDDSSNLAHRFVEFNYQSANYGGTDYYYFWTDKSPSVDILRRSPFRYDTREWNALAVIEDTLIVRRWAKDMPQTIDVHRGNLPSLYDDQGHRELAQAVGDELLAGAFLQSNYVAGGWDDSGLRKEETPVIRKKETPPGKLASYSEMWGTMDSYTVAVLGYSLVDGLGRNVIGLHYADREAAGRNADELTLRWNSSYLDIPSSGGSSRTGPLPDVHQLYTDICASFDTRTVEYEKSSVLIGSCAPTDLDLPLVGADGDDLWWGMVYFHELHLLVPDPGELAK
ncbi:MAG: hypothetical protein OXC95_08890, partial [Dehalococcoidia bacterium]|nr:hypothetical protein [Dehalococcoidia bacterium]